MACAGWLCACSSGRGHGPPIFSSSDGSAGTDATDDGARPPVDGGDRLDDVLIYAHSRDTLFTFSPYTLMVTRVGPFTLPDGTAAPFMVDLAVDSIGNVYTASDTALYRANPETADVIHVGELDMAAQHLYALTFVPRGAFRTDREALIGATNEGQYFEVDAATASTTYLGQYPDGWRSSGDLVSIEGLGTFATVRREDFPSDVLVQIQFAPDGSSSVLVKGAVQSATGAFVELFGLGYWGRAVYGFSNAGELIEINRDSGEGRLVTADTGTPQFWGAGVTTRAPVLF